MMYLDNDLGIRVAEYVHPVTSHCPLCEAAPCSEPSEPRCPRGIGASASKIEKPRDKDSPRR
jgi:hypothetical protein